MLLVSGAPARGGAGARVDGSKAWQIKLTPVGTVDEALIDPYGPPNRFVLHQIYGDHQLALALGRYTQTKLKEAVTYVQQRCRGTRPKKLTKAAIIEHIVQTLTAEAEQSDA